MRSEGVEERWTEKGKGREFGRKRRREETDDEDEEEEEKEKPASSEEQRWREFLINRTMVIDVETRRSRREMELRMSAVERALEKLVEEQQEMLELMRDTVVWMGDRRAGMPETEKGERKDGDEEMGAVPEGAAEGGAPELEAEGGGDGNRGKDGEKDGEENGDGDVEMK